MNLDFSMLAQKYASPYEYKSYGEPIFNETDENGVTHTVYSSGARFVIVCSTNVHIFDGDITFKNMTGATKVPNEALQKLAIEIAKSIKY